VISDARENLRHDRLGAKTAPASNAMMMTLLIAALSARAWPAWGDCLPSDILIRQADWHRETAEYVKVVGEMTNGCAELAGVQLQFTFRDGDGKVVDVSEPWPASTRNIPAKSSYPFAFSLRVDIHAKSMDTKAIGVRHW
jgi:hypothetical protein